MSRFLENDPHASGPQYLEDLATAYWFSEVLFTAVDSGLFTLLDGDGKPLEEISAALSFSPGGLERFLYALKTIGLLVENGSRYFNTTIAGEYLVKGKEYYQGDSILWRRDLVPHWSGIGDCLRAGGRTFAGWTSEEPALTSDRRKRYLRAMDNIAKVKVRELIPFFRGISLEGEMLDVGGGSAAMTEGFLAEYPLLKAIVADLPDMLQYTREFVREKRIESKTELLAMNILGPWPFHGPRFDIVMLSNIIHAYSEKELPHILTESAGCLKEKGVMVIHDLFFEHFPEKTAAFDLNMLINTYNGRAFSAKTVCEGLKSAGLHATPLLPLGSDTGVIVASKSAEVFAKLRIDKKAQLASKVKALGFRNAVVIPVTEVHIPDWTDMRCRYGCGHFGKPNCPPHAPTAEETRLLLQDFSYALVLEGEPPARDFQKRVLRAEREAFHAGFYKAFSYWAGPCSICDDCAPDGDCRNTRHSRPSMEAAGIDVFKTVKSAGISVRTLTSNGDFVKYFGLLLLE